MIIMNKKVKILLNQIFTYTNRTRDSYTNYNLAYPNRSKKTSRPKPGGFAQICEKLLLPILNFAVDVDFDLLLVGRGVECYGDGVLASWAERH